MQKGRKGKKLQKAAGPKVVAPEVQKALGTDPLSPQAQTEGTVLLVLFALFSLIILEGLLLALSVSNVCWPLSCTGAGCYMY